MTEIVDTRLGLTRHEYGTTTPDICRRNIEKLVYVRNRYTANEDVQYTVDFMGCAIDIRSTPTRTILFCENRYAMSEFEKLLDTEAWEYDNTTERTDYVRK